MTVRAVFFDAGHTLVHAHPSLGEVYAEVTARFGPRIPAAQFVEVLAPAFRESYGRTAEASDEQDRSMWWEITSRLHARMPEMKGVDAKAWFEALWRRFGEPSAWRMYEDVVPTLKALRARGVKLAVVSNWDTRLRGIAEGIGLEALVDAVVISSEIGARKPDPRIFRRALEATGASAAEAVHVGDLYEEDIAGARAAGMRAVWIDRNFLDLSAHPDVPRIQTLAELSGHL